MWVWGWWGGWGLGGGVVDGIRGFVFIEIMCSNKKQAFHFYLVDLNRMCFGNLNYQTRIENFTRLALTDEMIEIISLKYASLCNKDSQEVYTDMLAACHTYVYKRDRKRARLSVLKKKIKHWLSVFGLTS